MTRAPRLLAVDDQPSHLTLLRQVLTPAGYEVLEARSGGEALAVAQESVPDLILLDMHLPDMHGLDVLRRLRASAWGAGLRVVAMSALASPEDQALWREAGCFEVVEKPIAFAAFVRQLEQWLPGAPQESSAPQAGPPVLPLPRGDRLGEILVATELITPEQLDRALLTQAETGKRLGQILVQQGAVSEDDIAWALSNQLGYPYIFLTPESIDVDAAQLLPVGFLRERSALPILRFGQEMTLAMADPTDQRTVDDVVERTGLQVKRALALASNIAAMLDQLFYRSVPPAARQATEVTYAHFHLLQALQQEATEIHFDPGADGQARVRYRTQGVLVDRPAQSQELHAAILRWLRDLAGLGDQALVGGSAATAIGDVDLHLEMSFVPTAAGPAATVALHRRRSQVPDLSHLMPAGPLGHLRALPDARGVLLVGCVDAEVRATLLHGLIAPRPGRKAWVLERLPIYRRPTLLQTPVPSGEEMGAFIHQAAGAGADLLVADDLSHPPALRAALETGRSRRVLGGHPQDDVAGLLAQLLEVAGPALVASTLAGVLAARPIRLLCAACREPAAPAEPRGYASRGCEMCGFTGYRGQRVVSEIWIPGSEFRAGLRTGRVPAAVEEVLRTSGQQMREQGLALVAEGLTSAEELARVIDGTLWISPTS